ncbi:MAG: ATP-dependent Clp protease proteolytic subunit [Spirochaetia bacterium]|nr:ATP-dependent Clp protease proteolytic subunit [Spirochaetia bacterium]
MSEIEKIILNDKEKESNKDSTKNLREKIAGNFLDKRQIFLWSAIYDKTSEVIVEKLLYLEMEKPGEPIILFINSPGGVISAGMAIYDVMNMISSPVYTVTMGMAASMGAILFAAGEKGHRYVFPHAKIMIHQPLISGQIIAPAIDIKIHADEIKKTKYEINRILSETTGQPLEKIEKDTDRDYYLNSQEALKYGIADHILNDLKLLPTAKNKTEKTEEKLAKKTSAKKKK